MKKFYIALFALALNGVPVYGAECGVLCNFTCSGNRVEPITITATASQPPAAPVAQTMEAPTVAPAAQTVEIIVPTRTERKKPSLVPLTEVQNKRLLQIRKSSIKALNPLEAVNLASVPEDDEDAPIQLSIPPTFSQRNPIQDHKRLLNALRLRNHKKAQEILKTDIPERELNAKSKTGKTPLLYAIQQASIDAKNPTDNVYWDIVADLIARVDIELPSPSQIRDVVPHGKQRDCLLKYASLTIAY